MTDTVLVNSDQNTAPETIEVFYTANTAGAGTLITSFTASNNTTSSSWYRAYIYDSTGNPLPAIVPLKIVSRDRYDLGPPIVGQLIPPGGTLRMETSDASSIAYRVTGDEL